MIQTMSATKPTYRIHWNETEMNSKNYWGELFVTATMLLNKEPFYQEPREIPSPQTYRYVTKLFLT